MFCHADEHCSSLRKRLLSSTDALLDPTPCRGSTEALPYKSSATLTYKLNENACKKWDDSFPEPSLSCFYSLFYCHCEERTIVRDVAISTEKQ